MGTNSREGKVIVSQYGDEFHKMILDWENSRLQMREEDDRFTKAKMLVDGGDHIFFFRYKGSIYGANENARAVFSVMKVPMGEVGYEEMNFQAANLSSAMKGEPKEEIFVYKDVDEIEVVRKQEAYDELMGNKNGTEQRRQSNKRLS